MINNEILHRIFTCQKQTQQNSERDPIQNLKFSVGLDRSPAEESFEAQVLTQVIFGATRVTQG